MTRNLRKNQADRCALCGLRVALHFTETNRSLTCQQATEAHPRASVRALEFLDLLERAAEYEAERRASRRLTRQERLEGLADSGCDTWSEYRGER